MKGIRFYAELPSHRGSKSASKRYAAFTRHFLDDAAEQGQGYNCIAVLAANGQNTLGAWDAYAPINDRSHAPVEFVTVNPSYLLARCVRVSEDTARQLHPELFGALDSVD